MAQQALAEMGSVFGRVSPGTADRMCDEILKARRIACYGVGREGVMMKALCMRLMHLGLDAHVVGEMTVPPISSGGLLLASAGPVEFSCWPGCECRLVLELARWWRRPRRRALRRARRA